VIAQPKGASRSTSRTSIGFLKASAEESLYVCQDCYRRVQQTEYDAERKVHVVTLRSLT
jgi:hypothetical protein